MISPDFTSAESWLRAVDSVARAPSQASALVDLGITAQEVLRVARAEVHSALPGGVTTVSASDLAALAGVSREQAAKARIFLGDAGLQSLQMLSRNGGTPVRLLHAPAAMADPVADGG